MDFTKYPNFTPLEVECPCCGRMGVKPHALETLQLLRERFGGPLKINSAYRCPEHNKEVGGKPSSQHLEGTAFDISVRGFTWEDQLRLVRLVKECGFKGIGYYKTFLHVDLGRERFWGSPWDAS